MPTRAKTKKTVEKPTKKTPKMAEKSRNKGTGINLKIVKFRRENWAMFISDEN